MRELALFAGAGGGILGGHLLGWRTVCAVESDPYACGVLVARQNDGCLSPFPIWDDVRTFDGGPWRGLVDVVSGGFPCQDISVAGTGAGLAGERSGLWRHMARIVREVRPRFVLVENSAALVTRGLGTVLADLAGMGFAARWGVFSAADVGAPHLRKRQWILAYADCVGLAREFGTTAQGEASSTRGRGPVPDSASEGLSLSACERIRETRGRDQGGTTAVCDWWATEPTVGRMAHGVAYRVDRLKNIGNGQVPRVAALAFEQLARGHE